MTIVTRLLMVLDDMTKSRVSLLQRLSLLFCQVWILQSGQDVVELSFKALQFRTEHGDLRFTRVTEEVGLAKGTEDEVPFAHIRFCSGHAQGHELFSSQAQDIVFLPNFLKRLDGGI